MKCCEAWLRSSRSAVFCRSYILFRFQRNRNSILIYSGINVKAGTVKTACSGACSYSFESGKMVFRHDPSPWPASNKAGTFISMKSQSWAVFSVVVEADFYSCSSSVAVRLPWFMPLPQLLVPLWDQQENVPGFSLSFLIQIQVMSNFILRHLTRNLWKKWQTTVVPQKTRWSQSRRPNLLVFDFWTMLQTQTPIWAFKNLSWSHVELMKLIVSCFLETFPF